MKVLAQFQVVFFRNIFTLTACTVLLVSGQLHNDTLMFPFGTSVGDIEAPATDDGFIGPISTATPFKFFNSMHNQLFVNVNGAISFVKGVNEYVSKCGALDDESAMVAPYWADVDLKNGGNLYMRETKNESLLRNAELYIKKGFPNIDLTLNWLYVVTWHKVAVYRRSTVCGRYPSDLANTFQVILATDGTQSFVLIFYKTLRWTTGTNHRAGGGNCAGLGGTPAKAGFDVGNGATFYDIQGSCTDSVLDLVTKSNIDVPGTWIFQVDNGFAPADVSRQSELQHLTVTPAFVSGLSRQYVSLYSSGLTYTNSSLNATCYFYDNSDVLNVTALVDPLNSLTYCQLPYIQKCGRLKLELHTGDKVHQGHVYVTEAKRFVNVSVAGDHKIITIRWSLDIFSQAVTYLNVSILTFENNTFQEMPLFTQIRNTGQYSGELTYGFNVSTMAVRLTPTVSGNDRHLGNLPNTVGFVQSLASNIKTFVSKAMCAPIFTHLDMNFASYKERCLEWYNNDPGVLQDGLEPCPPTVRQALVDYRFSIDDAFYDREYFHPGGVTAFRQAVLSWTGARQQCVYDASGSLIIDGPGRGTVDAAGNFSHWLQDVKPYCDCCKYSNNCDKYFDKRPADNGHAYIPPAIAKSVGDPHITTFDGFSYLFNGVGEFWMVKMSNGMLSVQGRMEPLGSGFASVCTAYVLDNRASRIQVEATSSGISVSLNRILVPFPPNVTEEVVAPGIRISHEPSRERVIVVFSCGFTFVFSKSWRSLNLQASVSNKPWNIGNLKGLFGNFDGNAANDLILRNGTQLSPESDSKSIHYNFGLHWSVAENESLFTYGNGKSWGSYSNLHFEPWFERDASLIVPSEVVELCANSSECLFDWAASGGNPEFSNYTRKSVEEFEFTRNTSGTGVPMCSTIPPIRNGYFTLPHYMLGSMVNFTCDPGFRLMGPDTLTCLSVHEREAAWDGDIPRCESGQDRATRTTQRPSQDLDCKPQADYVNSSVVYVREGCSFTLNCNTHFTARRSFYTDKMIKWYKDDSTFVGFSKDNSGGWQLDSIPVSGVSLQTNQSTGHKIVLTEASEDTAGTYECEALADSTEFKVLRTVHFVRILAVDEKAPTIPPSTVVPTTELTVVANTSPKPEAPHPISTTSVPQNRSSDSITNAFIEHVNEWDAKVRDPTRCIAKGKYCGLNIDCCRGTSCFFFYCRKM